MSKRNPIADIACWGLDLLDSLKAAKETKTEAEFNKDIQYAQTFTNVGKLVIAAEQEKTKRAELLLQYNKLQDKTTIDSSIKQIMPNE